MSPAKSRCSSADSADLEAATNTSAEVGGGPGGASATESDATPSKQPLHGVEASFGEETEQDALAVKLATAKIWTQSGWKGFFAGLLPKMVHLGLGGAFMTFLRPVISEALP